MLALPGKSERIPVKLKKRITDIQATRVSKLEDYELWGIARLMARRLFGPIDLTMSSKDASSCAKLIMASNPKEASNMVLFALSRLAAKTGESLDINEKLRKEILNYFKDHNCQENIVKHVEEVIEDSREESKQILGDSLPLGLTLKANNPKTKYISA